MAKESQWPKPRLPTREEITARAYQIYLSRGGAPGRDLDDWLQAEYELMQLPVREIAKLEAPPRKQKPIGITKSLIEVVRAAVY